MRLQRGLQRTRAASATPPRAVALPFTHAVEPRGDTASCGCVIAINLFLLRETLCNSARGSANEAGVPTAPSRQQQRSTAVAPPRCNPNRRWTPPPPPKALSPARRDRTSHSSSSSSRACTNRAGQTAAQRSGRPNGHSTKSPCNSIDRCGQVIARLLTIAHRCSRSVCSAASAPASALSLSLQLDRAVAGELRDYEMRLIDKQKKIIQQFEEVRTEHTERQMQEHEQKKAQRTLLTLCSFAASLPRPLARPHAPLVPKSCPSSPLVYQANSLQQQPMVPWIRHQSARSCRRT